jgi:hypothetical protein
MWMQFSNAALLANTFYLGVYAAIYDTVAAFADQQGGLPQRFAFDHKTKEMVFL